MGALTSLIVLSFVSIGALIIANIINRHERHKATKKHYQQTMRQRAEELEELVSQIEPILPNRGIAKEINDMVIDKFKQIQEIEPSEYVEIALENAIQRSEEYLTNPPDRRVTFVAGSDAQIALYQKKLNAAGKVLKRLRDESKLTEKSYKDYMVELRWSYLQVEVMTYMHNGYRSRQREDGLTANAFFKKAADVLRTSGVGDDRKNYQIREVSEIIRGKRKKMSHQTNEEALLTADDINDSSTMSMEPEQTDQQRRDESRRRMRGEKEPEAPQVDANGFPVLPGGAKRSY